MNADVADFDIRNHLLTLYRQMTEKNWTYTTRQVSEESTACQDVPAEDLQNGGERKPDLISGRSAGRTSLKSKFELHKDITNAKKQFKFIPVEFQLKHRPISTFSNSCFLNKRRFASKTIQNHLNYP